MGDQEDLPTNTIDEDEPQEQEGGRSYECIYCKRGLTSAQALGGHMNIHRKDRAKSSRPNDLSNNNSDKQEATNFYAYPKFYHPVFTSFPNHQEGHTTYFSSSSSIGQPIDQYGNHHQDVHGPIAGEENKMSLSLQFGWPAGEHSKDSKGGNRSGNKEDELDLELRLGHDP